MYTGNHGPRHLAQQGHLRARPYGFRLRRKTPQAKVRGGMVLLIVRGLLRRPSLSGTTRQSHFARYTSTMLWPRNVTLPLSSSSALHGVYGGSTMSTFIGGDFNMSAFSTVSDVFSDP